MTMSMDNLAAASPPPLLSIGCPVWGCERWRGSLYTAKATREEFIEQYSRVFSTVEVNSTFYALPSPEIVENWARRTPPGFQFCLKFPKAITHDCQLAGSETITRAFQSLLRIHQEHQKLGPAFLQLSPHFSARQFIALARYIHAWPIDLPMAIETRHPDFFDQGPHERRLDELLRERGIDRCLFDSRALFSATPSDESERESQHRKPRSPFRTTATAQRPMVRFVGRNSIDTVKHWIEEWASQVSTWISQGLRPILFAHTPDDAFAPEFARKLHTAIRRQLPEIPALPRGAGDAERRETKTQRMLF